jgi:hypothetical protein
MIHNQTQISHEGPLIAFVRSSRVSRLGPGAATKALLAFVLGQAVPFVGAIPTPPPSGGVPSGQRLRRGAGWKRRSGAKRVLSRVAPGPPLRPHSLR